MTTYSRHLLQRIGWLFAAVGYYVGGYFVLNIFNEHRSYYIDVSLPFEAHIPFIPFFALPYSGVFLCVVLGFHSMPVERVALFRKGALMLMLNLTIAFAFFLVMPVRAMHRPVVVDESFFSTLAAFWFWVDKPTNLFPSLHVCLSLTSALVGLEHSRFYGWLTVLVALGVAVAAILIHQHYLADVVAGAALALGTHHYLFRRQRPGA